MCLCLEVILITHFFFGHALLAVCTVCVPLLVRVCLCLFLCYCVLVHVSVPHCACAIGNLLINQQLRPGAVARDREANKETDREREDQSRGL